MARVNISGLPNVAEVAEKPLRNPNEGVNVIDAGTRLGQTALTGAANLIHDKETKVMKAREALYQAKVGIATEELARAQDIQMATIRAKSPTMTAPEILRMAADFDKSNDRMLSKLIQGLEPEDQAAITRDYEHRKLKGQITAEALSEQKDLMRAEALAKDTIITLAGTEDPDEQARLDKAIEMYRNARPVTWEADVR